MYECAFEVCSFDYIPQPACNLLVAGLTMGLAEINSKFLLAQPQTPALYGSGVTYAPPPNVARLQPWRDIPRILEVGTGTCMDLAAWRVAELRIRHGLNVWARVTSQPSKGGMLYHVTVQNAEGHVEDPSKILGMGADEWAAFGR